MIHANRMMHILYVAPLFGASVFEPVNTSRDVRRYVFGVRHLDGFTVLRVENLDRVEE